MLSATGLTRTFQLGAQSVHAVEDLDLDVADGEFLRIVGASGSGKSTVLNLIGGLDRPTAGRIMTPLGDLTTASPQTLARWRSEHVGMVFQTFNLIPHRDALHNVEIGLLFTSVPRPERLRRSRLALERLGLGDRLLHRPADLSGGERQRVALARALVKDPSLLLADEPTGNLDRENAEAIAAILGELNRSGVTVLLVTHDHGLAAKICNRTVALCYGRIAGEEIHRPLKNVPDERS